MTVTDAAKTEVIFCNHSAHSLSRLDNKHSRSFIKHVYQGQLYLRHSTGEENDNPLQYSCLENHMDWGAW